MRKQKQDPVALTQIAKDLVPVQAATLMADDYCTYAAMVNLGRAIPHVLDGAKPVQRRVLYAMHDLGLASDKPFRKSARVAGEVMGRLHPHCLDPETIVPLMSGKRLSLKQLADAGQDEWVMSWQDGKFVPALASSFAKGQISQVEYRVWLKGYSSPLICTGDHEWLANGVWTKASKLAIGDSLQSGAIESQEAYPVFAHRLQTVQLHRSYSCLKGFNLQVHHLDNNSCNADLANLMYLSASQHSWWHAKHDDESSSSKGYAAGRKSLFDENGKHRAATKAKNAQLMRSYNSRQSEYKAYLVTCLVKSASQPLTEEAYAEFRSQVYNAPHLSTLAHKGLSLADVSTKPILDTSLATGLIGAPTKTDRSKLVKGTSGRGNRTHLHTALAKYCESGRKYKVIRDVADTEKVHAGRWFAVVDRVEVLQLDTPKQYYCCHVASTNCYFIEVDGKLVLTHNSGSYGTMVNMATEWGNRYVTISGHGNWGSLSDGAAAERYTECRLSAFAEQVLLRDLDPAWIQHKQTYDAAWIEPVVLPARLPMLLLRDTAGIGVAAACLHVSYNLREVASLAKAAIEADGKLRPEQGLEHITMPDFAMGAQVLVDEAMVNAIVTGHGCVRQYAKAHFDEASHSIIVTELPQDVSPESVLNATYAKVKDGTFTRQVLADARDESDRSGTRVVWELHRKAWHMAPWLLRELYKHTNLRTTTSVNAVSVDADSRSYSCKGVAEVANEWARHRISYETSKLTHQCLQLEQRDELLKGMLVALEHILAVAQALIDGRELSTLGLGLSERQISAIEAMPLRTLRSKSRDKLRAEVDQIDKDLAWRKRVLSKPKYMVKHLCADIDELAKLFGDDRRTTAYVEPPEFAQAEATAAKLAAEAEASRTYGWLLDNRAEGKEHTYYRASKELKRLPSVEIKRDSELGVAALLSNGHMYWLPALAMPLDRSSAESIKALLAEYTGKPFEPGTYAVWSDIVDRSAANALSRELILVGKSWDKADSVCKRIDLSELANCSKRKKSIWVAVHSAIAIEAVQGLPLVYTVAYESGDVVAMDLDKQAPKLKWQAKAAAMRSTDLIKAVAPGNTTNKKRLSNRRS